MIAVTAGVRVMVATKPVDFRRGADGLVALVRETLRRDPFPEQFLFFHSKRADRMKIVVWDGSGDAANAILSAVGHNFRRILSPGSDTSGVSY